MIKFNVGNLNFIHVQFWFIRFIIYAMPYLLFSLLQQFGSLADCEIIYNERGSKVTVYLLNQKIIF